MSNKLITIGIPVYKAEKYICDCLASIQIQSIKDELAIIIAKDNPGEDYEFVKDRYPDLDITILECEKNTGPGLARQRCIDAAKTEWITFIDADDIFYDCYSLAVIKKAIEPKCIDIQTTFCEEVKHNNGDFEIISHCNENDPWIFGHLYNISLLNKYNIKFSSLRMMEDGEFNWKIDLLVTQNNFPVIKKYIKTETYLWKSYNHSITRVGKELNGGVPLYTWDLAPVGHTVAAINVINFLKKQNPLNPNIITFAVGHMIYKYFTYIQCLYKKPLFADLNFFNAKRFYYTCYNKIENSFDKTILKNAYSTWYREHINDMENIIPTMTFLQFLDKIKNSQYGGEKEYLEIRAKLPSWVHELNQTTGVVGKEEYIYADGEEQ